MNLSNYLENALLDHVNGVAALAQPASIHVALFTSDPQDDGSGAEVAGGSYARQAVSFAAAANGVAESSTLVQFPVATATWGTITHVGLFDAGAAGNLLWHGPVDIAKLIDSGDQYRIEIADLTLALD